MHCISPPTETKMPLDYLRTPNERPAPAPAGVSARHGRGGRWPVALGHRLDCGYLGFVAKAMALAKTGASLGGIQNVHRVFPAYGDSGA